MQRLKKFCTQSDPIQDHEKYRQYQHGFILQNLKILAMVLVVPLCLLFFHAIFIEKVACLIILTSELSAISIAFIIYIIAVRHGSRFCAASPAIILVKMAFLICGSFILSDELKTDIEVYETIKNSQIIVYPLFAVVSVLCSESFKMYAYSHIPTFFISMVLFEIIFQRQASGEEDSDEVFLEVKLTCISSLAVISLTSLLAWVFHEIRL